MTGIKFELSVAADQVMRVKHSHLAVTTGTGDLLFPFSPGMMIGARYERIRYQVLSLLNGRRTVREIHLALQQRGYNGSLEDILKIIHRLAAEKLLESGNAKQESAEGRYDRQELFMASFAEDGQRFSAEIQEKLSTARIAVIGIGGIGSHALMSLIAMGAGSLVIVDGDKVALSNLNRQLFYTEQDTGKNKTEVLKQRCPERNSAINYKFLYRNLRSTEDFISVIKGCDLVLMAADTPRDDIFSWSHEAAVATSIPVLYTQGVFLDSISVGPLYIPGKTDCFHCFYPYTAYSCASREFEHINRNYQHGSCMPHVAITGQIMALEAVKHLTGFHECRLYNHIFSINLDTYASAYKAGTSTGCSKCTPCRNEVTGTT